MIPDSRATRVALAAVLLFFRYAEAKALTLDLGEMGRGETVPVAVSKNDTSTIEFPETIMNAFSSKESLDVKIFGKYALVRTETAAELIVLTEKRRLTLMLLPEDAPSRTVVIRADEERRTEGGRSGDATGRARAFEKVAVDLVVSLLLKVPGNEGLRPRRSEISDSLFTVRFAVEENGRLAGSAWLLENKGKKELRLSESMFRADPETVAVALEKRILLPGESTRAAVVVDRGKAK